MENTEGTERVREECWKDLTPEECHLNFCLDDDGHSHSEHRLQRTQNESNSNGSISESTCSGTAGISSSKVSVEIHGLRRRGGGGRENGQ